MFDAVTLDQLRTFAAVVDDGSFSAAARRTKRVQSAVSQSMAALEAHLGVALWNRSTRVATLTPAGRALLVHVRRVLGELDALARDAEAMRAGVEASVSLCVDAVFPVSSLVDLCLGFARVYPGVDLRVETEAMTTVGARVRDGAAMLGIATPLGALAGLMRTHLGAVRMVPVVAGTHPLAATRGAVPTERLAAYVQMVLSERAPTGAPDQAVLSPRTWRVADLATKHALLRAGLGWGNLPEHMIREDLRRRALVAIRPAAWGRDEHLLPLSLVHRTTLAPGPAARWIINALGEFCARELHAPERRGRSTKRRA